MTSSSDEINYSPKKTYSTPLDFNDLMNELNESPDEQIIIEPIPNIVPEATTSACSYSVPDEIVGTTLVYTTEPMQNAEFVENQNTGRFCF